MKLLQKTSQAIKFGVIVASILVTQKALATTQTPTPTSTPTSTPAESHYYFIQHKPTNLQFHSCSNVDGTAVKAQTELDDSICAQWRRIPIGDFFFLQNRASRKYIRPDTAENNSPIVVRPSSWTGAWTQWSLVNKGGFGHLKNRATGKFVFVPQSGEDTNLQQQPSTWQGDYTQWAFVPVSNPQTPPATPIVTPSVQPTPTATVTTTPTATPTVTTTPTLPVVTMTATPTQTAIPTCTPRPIGPARLEAELSVLNGSARVYDDAAASGGQGVAFINELGAGISFTNISSSNGFEISYASQLSGQLSFAINGADAGDINFSSTGSWTGTYNTISVDVNIPQNATLEIFYDNGDAAMNIDVISITNNFGCIPNATPTPTFASTPSPTVTPNTDSSATYSIVFTSNWRAHGPLPNNAHFTDLVGATHNSNVTFLAEGALATQGVEQVAELGSTGSFANEVNGAIGAGNATQFIDGPSLFLLNTSSTTITINGISVESTHPLISLVSMIAPSPDWMIAVSNLSLLDENGQWVTEKTMDLFPYDAGTEEGSGYSLNNPATVPQEVIRSLQGVAPFNNEKIGTITFTRVN